MREGMNLKLAILEEISKQKQGSYDWLRRIGDAHLRLSTKSHVPLYDSVQDDHLYLNRFLFGLYDCEICNIKCKTRQALMKHMNRHKKTIQNSAFYPSIVIQEPVLTGDVEGICLLCDRPDKRYRIKYALRHVILIHLIVDHDDGELKFLGLER